MVRVFIAVEPAKEIRENIEKAGLSLRGTNARLTLPTANQMHITLKFLGEVPENKIPRITAALEKVKAAPFELTAARVSTFGQRVIKAEVTDNGACASLAKQIDALLLPLGFPKDTKPFSPHITMARIKEYAPDILQKIAGLQETGFGSCTIHEFVLKQSTLTPQGSIYTTIAGMKL